MTRESRSHPNLTKLAVWTVIAAFVLVPAQASFVLPPAIVSGLVQSETGQSGGLFVNGVDEKTFISYIQTNWRSIIKDIECLPLRTEKSAANPGGGLPSIGIFGASCEELPPLEYVEFLERMLVLFEQERILADQIEVIVLANSKKDDFLSVKWENSRVKVILARARKLIPPDDVALLSCLDAMADGSLAENYLIDKGDDAPRPETLPGIKLMRPWHYVRLKVELTVATVILALGIALACWVRAFRKRRSQALRKPR